jgi:hypothetical protein
MDPNQEDPAYDHLDPLAPRPDDPRLGRWWFRRNDPSGGRAGSPLTSLAVPALAVAVAALSVWLIVRFA